MTPEQLIDECERGTRTIADAIARYRAELAPPPITVRADESVQDAITAAPAGATIELLPGVTYAGNLVISKPLTLQTAMQDFGLRRVSPADAPLMARLAPSTGAPLFDIAPRTTDVAVKRILLGPANLNDLVTIGHGDLTQPVREAAPQRITFDQVLIAGDPVTGAKRGISLHGTEVNILRSSIWDIKRAGADTQAICGWNGPGGYRVLDCYLEAAGENVMFGGADPAIRGLIPEDIVVRGCTIRKPLEWRGLSWTVKNLFELKAARGVTIADTLFENCWHAGHGGYPLMFTVQSQGGANPDVIVEDVLVEGNTFRNMGAGINLLGYAQVHTSRQSRGFMIRNNWFQIDAQRYGVQGWFLFLSREPRDVWIDRNTIETTGNAVLKHEGAPVQGFRFQDNLVPRCGEYGFTGNVNGSATHRAVGVATYLPSALIAGNAFGSFPGAANLPGNLHVPTSAITLADGYGTGAYVQYGRVRA